MSKRKNRGMGVRARRGRVYCLIQKRYVNINTLVGFIEKEDRDDMREVRLERDSRTYVLLKFRGSLPQLLHQSSRLEGVRLFRHDQVNDWLERNDINVANDVTSLTSRSREDETKRDTQRD